MSSLSAAAICLRASSGETLLAYSLLDSRSSSSWLLSSVSFFLSLLDSSTYSVGTPKCPWIALQKFNNRRVVQTIFLSRKYASSFPKIKKKKQGTNNKRSSSVSWIDLSPLNCLPFFDSTTYSLRCKVQTHPTSGRKLSPDSRKQSL